MYIFKFQEFVKMLKSTYPRIHPKGVLVPVKYYEWYIANNPTHSPSKWSAAYIEAHSAWHLKKDLWGKLGGDYLEIGYKGDRYRFPISVLFELEYNNRLTKLMDEKDEQ
jgi:hypothetical protein